MSGQAVAACEKNPSANYPAIPEIHVRAVGDDERGGASANLREPLLTVTDTCWQRRAKKHLPSTQTIQKLKEADAVIHPVCRLPEHVKKNPSANYSAVPEIRVRAVGDDERGGELVVTGDVGTRATAEPVAPLVRSCRRLYSTSETEYVEKSPTPNSPAVREICLLAVGDDEQGGVLTVTGVAGTSASRARDAVKQI
ncbi:hypothetical protein BKA83DRAFT_4481347 [Pisolithus microcarpus]|nr:hypothetical protein BKA83DRAFT_4481347 [Pisolithus microcarpus]